MQTNVFSPICHLCLFKICFWYFCLHSNTISLNRNYLSRKNTPVTLINLNTSLSTVFSVFCRTKFQWKLFTVTTSHHNRTTCRERERRFEHHKQKETLFLGNCSSSSESLAIDNNMSYIYYIYYYIDIYVKKYLVVWETAEDYTQTSRSRS